MRTARRLRSRTFVRRGLNHGKVSPCSTPAATGRLQQDLRAYGLTPEQCGQAPPFASSWSTGTQEAFLATSTSRHSRAIGWPNSARLRRGSKACRYSIVRRPMVDGGLVSTTEDIMSSVARGQDRTYGPARCADEFAQPRPVVSADHARARRGEMVIPTCSILIGSSTSTFGSCRRRQVATDGGDRLRTLVRETDTIARMGGDGLPSCRLPFRRPRMSPHWRTASSG